MSSEASYNEDEFDEESDEAHHHESKSGLRADLVELCSKQGDALMRQLRC